MIIVTPREHYTCGPLTMYNELLNYTPELRHIYKLNELEQLILTNSDYVWNINGPVLFIDGMTDKAYLESGMLREFLENHKYVFTGNVYCIIHNIEPKCKEAYEDFFSYFDKPVNIIPYRESFRKVKFHNARWVNTPKHTYFMYNFKYWETRGISPERFFSIGYVARKSSFRDMDLVNRAKKMENSCVIELDPKHQLQREDIYHFMSLSDKFLCGACKKEVCCEEVEVCNTLEYTAIEAILNGAIPILGPEYELEAQRIGLKYLKFDDDWNSEFSFQDRFSNRCNLLKTLKEEQFKLSSFIV